MKPHMLSTHEYLMLMHIHGQIENISPVFRQQLRRVHAFRKGFQQLVCSLIHENCGRLYQIASHAVRAIWLEIK